MTTVPDQLIPFEALPYPLNLMSKRHVLKLSAAGKLGPLRPIRASPRAPPVWRQSDADAYVRKLLADCGDPE